MAVIDKDLASRRDRSPGIPDRIPERKIVFVDGWATAYLDTSGCYLAADSAVPVDLHVAGVSQVSAGSALDTSRLSRSASLW